MHAHIDHTHAAPGRGGRRGGMASRRRVGALVRQLVAGAGAGSPGEAADASPVESYDMYLSVTSKSREPSALRELYPLLQLPGMLSLGNGQPNPQLFPFARLSVTTRDGDLLEVDGAEMDAAQQYADTLGIAPLRAFLEEFMADEHAPPVLECGRDHIVTAGSQDALTKSIEMLCDRNDAVMIESPSYPGAIGPLRAAGVELVGVPVDEFGIVPEALDAAVLTCPQKPRVLYLIPHGQNPSGSTMPISRKREVYAVARRHSLLIIEDDPYYALQFSDDAADEPNRSFYSIDVDGRVLRLDSFSKVLGSGMRLGWASGPSPLIEQLKLHQQTSTMQASTLSMTLAARLLQSWGLARYHEQMKTVNAFYRSRRDVMQNAAEKHLTGLATWKVPSAGMFFWFDLSPSGVTDSAPLILDKARDALVLLAPGSAFATTEGPSTFARAAFSIANDEVINEALRRFATVLREAQVQNKHEPSAAPAISAPVQSEQ